jgi:NAD(P)-dependent dehydrogenase (short-subunit alcohol dehydrogenase family)
MCWSDAGSFYAGSFEGDHAGGLQAQIGFTSSAPSTSPRTVLPVVLAQRSGLVMTTSSTAGIAAGEFLSAHAASTFGMDGWMESLSPEVTPPGIRTMLVQPGFFRTELTPQSHELRPVEAGRGSATWGGVARR